MKRQKVFLTAVILLALVIWSCDSDTRHDKRYDKLADLYGRSMIYNSLGRFMLAGNYSEMHKGGDMMFWYFMPGLMMFGDGGTTSNDSISQDTAFYDPTTGYWTYGYTDSNFSTTMRYKFTPRDEHGYPTPQTDSYVFEMSYNGNWNDDWWNMNYVYDGQSNYQISGLRNWNDSAIIGELVLSGNSVSNFTQRFSTDTSVTFSYTETINNVRMRENHCVPQSGSIAFRMIQNATPDSFSWDLGWTDFGLNEFVYTDFDYHGQTIFERKGIRWILDGEEYFWEVDCDDLWGRPANTRSKGLRK